jgi:hypothetical protein
VRTAANLQTEGWTSQATTSKGTLTVDKFNALSLGKKLVLIAGVVLLVDTFLNWQQVDTVLGSAGQSAWHGFWGVFIGLMTVALVAWVALRAFGNVQLPEGIPEGLISLVLGALILLFAVIKVISDSYVHWPAYLGILLAAIVTYGAWLVFKESGESLPSMSSRPASGGGSTSTATPPPPPAAPAPEPPAADPPPAASPSDEGSSAS